MTVMVMVCQDVVAVGVGLVTGGDVLAVGFDVDVGGTTVTVIDVMKVTVVVNPIVWIVIVVVIGTTDNDVVGGGVILGVGIVAVVAGIDDEFWPTGVVLMDVVMDFGGD
jgi:hypothetical protein